MAQCRGVTRKGEQCKRDARDGSDFCAIHLDQEVHAREPRAESAAEWDTEALLKAALGFALIGALLFLGRRR